MRTLRFLLLVLAIYACSVIPCTARPQKETVVLVTLEGVSLDQLAKWNIPEFSQILHSGAIGLMNDRGIGTQTFSNNSVSIGAGTRATGLRTDLARGTTDDASLAFNADEQVEHEPAEEIFSRDTGVSAPAGAVVHIGSMSLRQLNMSQYYTIIPGLLGSELGSAGVSTLSFGNSDRGEERSREAVSIAMDENGVVSGGDVGPKTVMSDPHRPFGVKTNYDYIFKRIEENNSTRSFVVVEAGDGARVGAVEAYLSPDQSNRLKYLSTLDCCRFITRLESLLKSQTDRYLILLAVGSQDSVSATAGDQLTPIVMTGTNVHEGVLTSQTTRRSGVVINLDIAPTVLGFFDVQPHSSMLGRPLMVQRCTSSLKKLQAMNTQVVATDVARPPLMKGYIYLISLCVIGYVLLTYLVRRRPGSAQCAGGLSRLRSVCTAITLVPLALLVVPGFGIYTAVPTAALVVITAFTAALVIDRLFSDVRLAFVLIGLTTAIAVCADLVLGAHLLQKSVLSYSVIAGARFYGIGNEYSGVLLGSILLGVFALFDYLSERTRKPMVLLGFMYLVVFVLIGSPQFGTKFGGMIATMIGFSVAIAKMKGGRLWGRRLWLAGIAGVVLFAAIVAANTVLAPTRQTHIGHIFSQAQTSGSSIFIETALRKWAMNFKLMKYSPWAIALISMSLGLVALSCAPMKLAKETLAKHTYLSAGFSGILAVALVGFFTNDAGIVMASTTLIYLVFPLMLLIERERTSISESTTEKKATASSVRQTV